METEHHFQLACPACQKEIEVEVNLDLDFVPFDCPECGVHFKAEILRENGEFSGARLFRLEEQ